MLNQNQTIYIRSAMTIVEMVIAMAIMATVFAIVLPQFAAIRGSWNTKAGTAEALQNGRILMEHINRNISTAKRITDVSEFSQTDGFIEFESYDNSNYRYDVNSTTEYVEFGLIENIADLAGPVSQLRFTCYNANDFETPTTDVNSIRLVKVESVITNSAQSGRDISLSTYIYIRSAQNTGSSGLIGWWKLDETSDVTAADSSGSGNDGTLMNMAGNEWIYGILGGSLQFDGTNEYVDLPIDAVIGSLTDCTIATWVNWSGTGSDWQRIFDFGTGETYNMFLTPNTSGNELRFAITQSGWSNEDRTTASEILTTGWHHVAVTIDQDNSTHKLYLDGELVAENTFARYTPSDLGETDQNWLARSQYSVDPYFNGLLDDFRIYNRVLEPEEIEQLFDILRFCNFTESKSGLDNLSITISTPETNEGDLLIAAVATDGDTSSSISSPFGEGWTEINSADYSNDVTLSTWWKLADASESSSHQFTWSSGQQAYGWMMHFTGHDPDAPINNYSGSGETDNTPTCPATTTTEDNCLILRLGAFDGDEITVDSPGLYGHNTITMDKSSSGSEGQVIFEEFTETFQTGSNREISISKPGGTSQGDLLIAVVVTDLDTRYTLSPSPGDGWNEIDIGGDNDFFAMVTMGVWWKLADNSEPSDYEFTWWTLFDRDAYGWIMRFTGHHTTDPINAYASQGGYSHTPDCPSVTTTVPNTMVLRIGGFDDDDINEGQTGLSGHTTITMEQSDSGNGTCSGGAGYKQQAGTGACGVEDFSLSGSHSEEYRTVTVAIAPTLISGGTVSGGAGYINRTAGDSGTSDFSLDSSEQARMLTIAIAPNPENVITGGGEITP